MIYLDYSANTPADPAVLEAFIQTEAVYTGNPNSSHPAGRMAWEKLAEVTESIARLLHILPSEIIYTSGASEANNLAIKGLARAQGRYGKHIIFTALEHPSVSGPIAWLQELGYETDQVDIDRDGKIDLAHLKELLRDDTILLAVTAVDSELGTVQPVWEIAQLLKRYKNCRLHVDATQAIGKIPFSFEGIDTVSFAAHKFYGLNGSGIFYKRKNVMLEPLIHGGAGTSMVRSGTPTLGLAAAMETALQKSLTLQQERFDYVKALNDKLREALSRYPSVRINSPEDAVPHILNVSVAGIKGKRMQQLLAEQGVCVSVKSACSRDEAPSKAVYAVSKDQDNALSSWRISLSHLTRESEVDEFLRILDRCIGDNTPSGRSDSSAMAKELQGRIADKDSLPDLPVSWKVPTVGTFSCVEVACEQTVSVFVNDRLSMRIVCTPQYIDELIIGRLLTENMIDGREDIRNLSISERGLQARVELRQNVDLELADKEADFVPTCCTDNKVYLERKGKRRKSVVPIAWELSWFENILARLQQGEPLFLKTHATHTCYLAKENEVICCREDIGRHNALDKVIGYGLLHEIKLSECFLFTTGRIPTDMVKKAINAGIPIMASKTYPTRQAVEMAREAKITLITIRESGGRFS